MFKQLYFIAIFFFLTSNLFAHIITNVSTDSSACAGSSIPVTFSTSGFAIGTAFAVVLSAPDGTIPNPPSLTDIIGNGAFSPITVTIPPNSTASPTYSLVVVAISGTTVTAISAPFTPFEITTPIPSFTATITTISSTICPSTNATFNATLNPIIAGATYTWYIGSTAVPGAVSSSFSTSLIGQDTTVYCEVTVPLGCILDNTATSNTLNIIASGNPLPFQVSGTASKATICVGSNVVLSSSIITGSGNYSYSWSYINTNNPPVTIGNTNTISTNAIPAGAFVTLTVTSDALCLTNNPATVNIALEVSQITATPPKITIKQDVTFCNDSNDVGIFSVTPVLSNATYTWYIDGVALPSEAIPTTMSIPKANVVIGQKVSCKIISSNPCVINPVGYSNEIIINVISKPEIKITEDFTMAYGDKDKKIEIIGDVQASSVKWTPNNKNLIINPNSTNPTVTPNKSLTYTLDAIAKNGCKVSAEVRVTVVPNKEAYLPDIFSPNDDNNNDIYYFRNPPEQILPSTFLMRIFDETGTMVFESKYQNYGWDGTYRNKPCSQGSYFYYVYGVYFNSEELEKQGKLILIR